MRERRGWRFAISGLLNEWRGFCGGSFRRRYAVIIAERVILVLVRKQMVCGSKVRAFVNILM